MAKRGSCGDFARRAILVGAAFAMAANAFAERQPYSRYESIVERQMFGPLPPNFDPTKSPGEVSKSAGSASEKELTKEQEKLKSAVRFSVINVTPEGDTAIGFTDNSDPKAPVHYYLKVGESRGGWEVKEADAKSATMTIEKDGVQVSLSLGDDSSKGGGKTENARAGAGAQAPQRSSLLGSLAARRKAKREQEEADRRAAEAERAQREAEAKAREAEREEQHRIEREEQRKQLEQIKEELRRSREEKAREREEGDAQGADSAPQDGGAAEGE